MKTIETGIFKKHIHIITLKYEDSFSYPIEIQIKKIMYPHPNHTGWHAEVTELKNSPYRDHNFDYIYPLRAKAKEILDKADTIESVDYENTYMI